MIFRGCVTVAYADLNGSSPVLKIEAQVGAYPLLEPASTVSVQGSQDVGDFIKSQSAQAGFEYQNDGVQATVVRGHYLLTHFWTDKVTLTVESGAFS